MRCFNSRSPSGERPTRLTLYLMSDMFQLTLPEWGATRAVARSLHPSQVSTHAPRVGSDYPVEVTVPIRLSFNSRSPSGERRHPHLPLYLVWRFNSRSPSGERLLGEWQYGLPTSFNSRSPSGERLALRALSVLCSGGFNSRSPSGERPD